MRKEKKIINFFHLLQLFIFLIKVISNFFINYPLINSLLLIGSKKNKMGLELRIRKEKREKKEGKKGW